MINNGKRFPWLFRAKLIMRNAGGQAHPHPKIRMINLGKRFPTRVRGHGWQAPLPIVAIVPMTATTTVTTTTTVTMIVSGFMPESVAKSAHDHQRKRFPIELER